MFLELVAGRQAQAQAPPAPSSPPSSTPLQWVWPYSNLNAISLRCSALTHPHTLAQQPTLLVSPHAVEGQWLEWGPWGPCSMSCANGTQQRSRKCSVAGPAWATCTGALTDTRECGNLECPGECAAQGRQVVALAQGVPGATHAPHLCSHRQQVGAVERVESVLQDM